ncbi:DUF4252 domain-containing protein [Chitinophaga defluvii]|uniref:DUF4252 domain-containing protein n=1 Tax=Chitinophaga defluvii TaxID=3163343 RepID=A0ABV2T2D8_9BACT
MKRTVAFTIIGLLFLAGHAAFAQEKILREFRNAHRGEGETFTLGLSFVPLKLASWIIPADAIDEESGVSIKHIVRKIRSLKVYTIEMKDRQISSEDIYNLKQKLIRKAGFESLMEVRDKGSVVHILNKGRADEIGNLVMLVQDNKEMVMVNLHTSLKMEDLNALIRHVSDHKVNPAANNSISLNITTD